MDDTSKVVIATVLTIISIGTMVLIGTWKQVSGEMDRECLTACGTSNVQAVTQEKCECK